MTEDVKPIYEIHADRVVASGELDTGVKWYALESPGMRYAEETNGFLQNHGGYNGYVEMPRVMDEDGYDAISAVDVHGGATFFQALDDDTCIYGFDTMHYNSENYPVTDIDWIESECMKLYKGVMELAGKEVNESTNS